MFRVVQPIEEDRKEIKEIVLDLAEYYSTQLSDKQVEMYVEDLLDMGAKHVRDAASKYRKEWTSEKFPLPAQLRKEIYFGYCTF